MNSVTSTTLGEVEVLRNNARTTKQVLILNLDGVSHEDSLIHPEPAGNCINWVVGHLVWVYNNMLPLLGQKPVMAEGALKRYERGTPPLSNPADALPLDELNKAWEESCARIDTGLAGLTSEALDARAPVSPNNDPNETVRSLLAIVAFHQAYHTGQVGILRRIAGKKGAIA